MFNYFQWERILTAITITLKKKSFFEEKPSTVPTKLQYSTLQYSILTIRSIPHNSFRSKDFIFIYYDSTSL